jgi:hypothetical protein
LNSKIVFERVECFKLVDEGEIGSVDVNSLYPSVLASQILIMLELSPIHFYGVDDMCEKT